MSLREAAQQALEALEVWRDCLTDPRAKPGWRFAVVGEKAMNTLRASLAEDAMQRLTDVQQEMDCYGDGNVYRGQRSRDSKTPTLTFSKAETVEPVAWLQIGVGDHEGTVIATTTEPKTWNPAWWKFKPLYPAPPKRKPLTDDEIEAVADNLPIDDMSMPTTWHLRLARAIERAHGIGDEE